MTRVKSIYISAALLVGVMISTAPATAQEPEPEQPPLTSQQVTDNLTMISGPGGNLGVLTGPDATVLIDDQMAPVHEAILAEIEGARAPEDSDRTFLINTHFHADHTGGNELFGAGGAIIIAQENARERLTVDQFVPFFDMRSPAVEPVGLPVITFSTDVALHLNGEDIDVFHIGPGHTDGDAVVHFTDANVIHAGDLVFYGTYPFIDLDNGGDVDGFIAANQRILELCDDETKIITGHGPLIGQAEMQAYVDMLTTTRDAVAALVAEGKSLDEIVAAKPTAAYDEVWSTFIDAEGYLSLLHRGLSDQ